MPESKSLVFQKSIGSEFYESAAGYSFDDIRELIRYARERNISIIPEFIEKIELMKMQDQFVVTKDEIINIVTGSKIIFKGIKTSSGTQSANLKSLQGVTTWVLDEAEELTDEDTFDKIDLSIRHKTKQNRVILILNPTTKEHFIYDKFFESKGIDQGATLIKDDTTYIHTTYLDNIENLSESFLKQVEYIKELIVYKMFFCRRV